MAKFFDKIITLGGVWLLCLIWAGYFVAPGNRALISFVMAAAICGLLFTLMSLRKPNKPTKLQIAHMGEITNQLAFSDMPYNVKFFAQTLGKAYSVTTYKDYLVIASDKRKTIVFPFMRLIKLTTADLSEMYASVTSVETGAPILILTIEGATKSAADTAANLSERKVTVLDKLQVYGMLDELDSFPPVTLTVKKKRRKAGEFFRAALAPDKARRYLMISVFMLFTSLIVNMSIYYIIFASFVTMLAIACRLDAVGLIDKVRSKK